MELKKYTYWALPAILLFTACDDKEVDPNEPNAVISELAVRDVSVEKTRTLAMPETRAEAEDPTLTDSFIRRLTIAVYNDGAFEAKAIGTLLMTRDTVLQPGATESVTTIRNVSNLRSGAVKILLLANLPDGFNLGTLGSLENTLKATTKLDNERDGNLRMVSDVVSVTLKKGDNYVGLDESGASREPIKLYRAVARVLFKGWTLTPCSDYKNASFTPKAIFMANVRSLSRMGNETGVTEDIEDTDAELWAGTTDLVSYPDSTGALKPNANKPYAPLYASLEGHDGNFETAFYAYENRGGSDSTLLVVKGDFAANGINYTDRYYTIVVNKDGERSYVGSGYVGKHDYVRKNVQYNVSLDIMGPGSDKPFDRRESTDLKAMLKVADWNQVTVKETGE